MFEANLVQHSAAGISILGFDNIHPSRQTQSIVVRHNVFADIDNQNWGGNGYAFMLTGGPRRIVILQKVLAVVGADELPVSG